MKTFKPSVTKVTLFLIPFALGCFALCQSGQAVSPSPDGGYPDFTTAEGTNALKNLTTGAGNTAVGWYSLFTDTGGGFTPLLALGRCYSTTRIRIRPLALPRFYSTPPA